MIEFQELCKRFHGTVALDGVAFTVASGSIHALVGENGAGKSTLMKILSGVYQPDDGVIRIDGKQVHFPSPAAAQAAGINIIHQELNLIPYMTVAENITLGNEPVSAFGMVNKKQCERIARESLSRLGLQLEPARLVGSLRVGEQQLVEIAKALSTDTKVLILDEPTSALSETEIENLFTVMHALRDQGVTLIYISHKLNEVFHLADSITVLRDGRAVGTWPKDELTEAAVINHMVGRELNDLFPKTHVEPGEPVLTVANLSTSPNRFDDRRAIRDVNFTLRRGEILGVAGLMGAGRTEVLEAIYGVTPARERRGTITLRGTEHEVRDPQHAIDLGIAMVPEDRKNLSLVHEMSVRENTTLASLDSFSRYGVVSSGAEKTATAEEVNRLGIKTPSQSANIDALSGGNQQKVVLAKCLLTKPDVLLLDEPTRGIDVHAKSEIYALMSTIAESGAGIVMASSELPELLAMCDRILVMHEGRIAEIIDASDASQVAVMAAATGNVQLTETAATG